MHYDPDHYNPRETLGYLLTQALGALRTGVDRQLADDDLTAIQWQVLVKVGALGLRTGAEIAASLNQDPAGVTRMVDRLEAKGLLRRERSTTDRRLVEITLTPAGEARLPHLSGRAVAVLNHALRDFSSDELATLKALLRRIPANLDEPLP